jgi:FSR family fosmidomycin resistance protein-like MFS transporter
MISFIARSAVVVVVGFIADRVGLNTTYLISAAIGLISVPFVLVLPEK